MLELTRSIGELKARGQRPRRTLMVCSWDGEEYALTGSTEWGEQFQDDLKKKLVAYLNVDESVSGAATTAGPEGLTFEVDAVGSLAPMIVEASREIRAPSGKSLHDAWLATAARERKPKPKHPLTDADLVDPRIGSGSDHTVFLNHLGRPTVGLGFTGDYGVYHSQYDDHYWMAHIGDPDFAYHVALTRVWGVLALRLANADALPFDFGFYGGTLNAFVDELASHKGVKKHVDLKPLRKRVAEFEKEGQQLRSSIEQVLASRSVAPQRFDVLNAALMQVESNWLDPKGITGRPWFQHLLYAARYTYAHLELPALTEAVESQDWPAAKLQAERLEAAFAKNRELLHSARVAWEKPE